MAAARPQVARATERAQPAPAPAPDAVRALSTPSPEARIRARLDRAMGDMQATYLVDGREVKVTPHFRSLFGLPDEVVAADVARIKKAVGADAWKEVAMAAARATSSRGTAADVKKTVQALLDAGVHRRYGEVAPTEGVRRLMWDFRIGLDCRGYVGRAFLYSRGAGDGSAPAKRYDLDPAYFTQPSRGFKAVSVEAARAGDWIRLAPERKGGRDHNVIVRSNTTRQVEGARFEVSGKQVPRAFVADEWPAGSKPTVRVMEVDSAWGGGDRGDHGGVERRVWVRNEKTGLWGHWEPNGAFRVSAGPYDHPLEGVYRPRGER